MISTDLFSFKGQSYILLADHYSGFLDFQQLVDNTTSPEAIKCLKEWFSVHGIPEIVESDGGPQYSSKAFENFAKESTVESTLSKVEWICREKRTNGEKPTQTLLVGQHRH